MTEASKPHRGLSYSTMVRAQSCLRSAYHSKIAKTPIDTDASEDSEPYKIGHTMHKVLEVTKHDLSKTKYSDVERVAEIFELDPLCVPLVAAMLSKYKTTHEKSGLRVIAVEEIVDTPRFYGIVDAVAEDGDGNWWIADVKTAASFSPNLIAALPRNAQLNLYALHADILAENLGIDPDRFMGTRYRVTTKSKSIRKKAESLEDYISRLKNSIRSLDIAIPKHLMSPGTIGAVHGSVAAYMEHHKDEADYPPNYGNCMAYFKSCVYWSRCHGRNYTDTLILEVIEG